jgi:hypothetical protein
MTSRFLEQDRFRSYDKIVHSISQKLAFIEGVFGKGVLASNGKNFSVRCPICAPSDLNKRKLAIRTSDDAHHCWTCGWRSYSLAPLIKKYGSASQLHRYRTEFLPEGLKNRRENPDPESKTVTPLPADFTLLSLANLANPDVKAAWTYLNSRGIDIRDAWHYKLGFSNEYRWRRRIMMPSFDTCGALNFFVARNIDANDRRTKYDNPDDVKTDIVFNELSIDWNRQLVICEGPFDMMKCGDNSTALLGSDLSPSSRLFSQILLNNTPIALALDADMWYTKTPKYVKLLRSYDIDVVVVDTRLTQDPGSMTKSQFADSLRCALSPSWEDSFMDKLSKLSEVSLRLKHAY